MLIGNVRRSTESFRSLPIDIAVKGTLSSQLGKFATSSKFARRHALTRGLKVTRFATANAIGDVLGEIALQEVEIGLGQREKLSPLEIGISGGTSLGVSFALPVIGRFAARIGKIAPRDFKELAFRKITDQFKLILPKRIFDPGLAGESFSAEMKLGKRFILKTMRILKGDQNRGVRELADELGESIGVTAEGFGLPSAHRNANMLLKATQSDINISVKPLLDDALEIATERTVIGEAFGPFRQANNQLLKVMGSLEEKYAAQGFMVSPAEFNQIAGDLEDAALGTIIKLAGKGQQLAAPLARETETKRLFFKLFQTARNLLDNEMNAFSDGAWASNRAITAKTLANAETVAKKMTKGGLVELVETAAQDEATMGLIATFDELNGTQFSKEIYELFLSRRLGGGVKAQTEPITGFARTVAPLLVIMTQVAKFLGIAVVRPASAATGGVISTLTREGKKVAERFEEERQLMIQELEIELNRKKFPELEADIKSRAVFSRRIKIGSPQD